jgi:hypothetical protein
MKLPIRIPLRTAASYLMPRPPTAPDRSNSWMRRYRGRAAVVSYPPAASQAPLAPTALVASSSR